MKAPICVLLSLAALLAANGQPRALHGALLVHDPSTIIRCGSEYWLFGTGPGLRSLHSKDLTTWEAGPRVFANSPAWTTNAVPGNRGYFWAPDIIRLGDVYLLYYSVSTWGSQTSAIGLATNPTLDPVDPAFAWTDRGPVIRSSERDSYNAIDPSLLSDAEGRLWLAFGSYWSGIKLIELDPQSGLTLHTNAPVFSLAWHESIEAACLCQHDGYYYLFVNWGQCCRGVKSTYNIRVGRSRIATGPFLDKDRVDLLGGGGSLILGSEASWIGPGHAGLFVENGQTWFSYHYYDGINEGASTLAIRPLIWNVHDWPELSGP